MQINLNPHNNYEQLDQFFISEKCRKILLVCGGSIKKLKINTYFNELKNRLGIDVIRFSDFTPNPKYESVVQGVQLLIHEEIEMIVAVGGGSAIDVAKCIKLFANMNHDKNYLTQPIVANDKVLIAIPTTAGTGSEATRFAVIYHEGNKQSVCHDSCIPKAVLFDSDFLINLPEYQKKVTMLDALCHAIESYWSINSTEESKEYSKRAIELIFKYQEAYFQNDTTASERMFEASNLAGKAINITKTTAGHAMSYKLTSMYGISHGHAVALCVSKLIPYMLLHSDLCIDSRGEAYFLSMMNEIGKILGGKDASEIQTVYDGLLTKLNLEVPMAAVSDFEILKKSVNVERLGNHPISLDENAIDDLYHKILFF